MSSDRRHSWPALLLWATMLFASTAAAQEARLSGTVTDATGGALAGAHLTATQTERNLVFGTTTGSDGRFVFARLPIGNYQVKAEATGFKQYVKSDLPLTTNADALLNVTMEIGAVTEQVTVVGESTRVSTESATIQQLVDSARIVELPLNGRNVYQLARLVPGTGPGGFNIGGGKTGGQQSNMVNVRLDGNLNVNTAYGDILPSPSPDAVQEFSVQTSVPSARYGWASGVIEVSTRGGTNQLHGSLYEFLRNDKLDARSFFQPSKTKRKRNQYGVAAGGPFVIPKLYDGRNKTFWFANFEQQKELLGAPVSIFVPTDLELRGDFSRAGRIVRDPLNNQLFVGNIIPQTRLDPLALNYSKKFVPTTSDPAGLYQYQRPADNNPSSFLIRADQLIASRHQLSARSFITRREGPSATGNLPAFQASRGINDTDFVGASYVWTISPNKINSARFGFNGTYSNAELFPKISDAELVQLGWSSNFRRYNDNVPAINVPGFFAGSTEFSTLRDYSTYSWSDDFSWILGRHTLMMGVDAMHTIQEGYSVSRTHGLYTFSGAFSGLALSDFFLGRPNTLRQGNPAIDRTLALHMALYFQDDFKLNRRFTVSLGLRYEIPLPPESDLGQTTFYRPGQKSRVYTNAPAGLLYPGDKDTSGEALGNAGYARNKNYWAPRIGLAYALTPDQKMVLRAGYGMYYAPAWTNVLGQLQIYQPFIRIIDLVAPPSTADPWAGYPGGRPHPYDRSQGAVFDKEIAGFAFGPNFREPMMQQWNLGIQREFARNLLATISYVGTRGTRIPYLRDINPAAYIPSRSTVANTNERRPLFPDFARFSLAESAVNSSYHSLQASLDRRFSGGLTILASYTFSKALTDLNGVLTNDGGVPDPNNRRLEWAPAAHDRTHAFVASWVWQIPYASSTRGLSRVLLHGWELNGIWSAYSGGPLSFFTSQDRSLRGQPNRADRLRDARLSSDRTRAERIARYFDTAAYAPNRIGEFGTAPRAESQLRGPGSMDVTLGIFKRFRGFWEAHNLQLRTELFNPFNRPNFSNPGTNVDAPASLGRIVGAGDGRIIQFGLKYLF
ncbi:MAG: TonB-dependent receptor domain-containing protein [Bryobacteraceae bacterium]